MFTKIAIMSIPVRDQQVARSFYTEKLGARIVQDNPFGADGNTRWIMLALPGVETQLVLVTWFPQMPPGCVQGLVLHTDDMTHAYAELKQRGVAISEPKNQPYGQEATFSDPDGNGWVLLQPRAS